MENAPRAKALARKMRSRENVACNNSNKANKQTNKQWPKSPMVIVVGNSQAREKAGLWSKSTTKVKESKVIGIGGNESLQKVWVKKATNNIYFYLNILHLRRRNHLFLWNISNK